MSTTTVTRADVRLRDAVIRALDWDPRVATDAIGVAAHDGVVTLTGIADSCASKLTAERVAKHVRGVRAVANDLVVRLAVAVTDTDVAAGAALALRCARVPQGVQAAVHNGHVTLTGQVQWLWQKERAEVALQHVPGVRSVHNYIEVAPRAVPSDVQRRIVQALHREADLDARHIDVTVAGDVVTLRGTVTSWPQRDAAERGAGGAPGIRSVDNQLAVVPREPHEFELPEEIC